MSPFEVELLFELLLVVLPVLLFLPPTLYREKGSTVRGGGASLFPTPLKKASLAARVLSAWFEFVDAKLSEDLYKLNEDLFKLVFDALNSERPLAKLPVDLFKLLLDTFLRLVDFEAFPLSLLLILRDLDFVSTQFTGDPLLPFVCTSVLLFSPEEATLRDRGREVGGVDDPLVFGFTNTGYRGSPVFVVLNALPPPVLADTELEFCASDTE